MKVVLGANLSEIYFFVNGWGTPEGKSRRSKGEWSGCFHICMNCTVPPSLNDFDLSFQLSTFWCAVSVTIFFLLAYITPICWTARFLSSSFPPYGHDNLDLLYDTISLHPLVWYQSSWATTTTSTSTRGVMIPIYLVTSTTDSLHWSAVVFKLY